VLTKITDINLR